jgi:hypothetical protein
MHITYHTFIIHNNTICATVYVLLVFLYDIMMAANNTYNNTLCATVGVLLVFL